MGYFGFGSDVIFVPKFVIHCFIMGLEIMIEFEKVTICRELRFLFDVSTFLLRMAECNLVKSGWSRWLNVRDMLTSILFFDSLTITKLTLNLNFSTVINHL